MKASLPNVNSGEPTADSERVPSRTVNHLQRSSGGRLIRNVRGFAHGVKAAFLLLFTFSFCVAGELTLPEPPSRRLVEAALVKPPEATTRLRIVLLADKKDHKANEHDYPLWRDRWSLLLGGKTASGASQVNLFGPPTGQDETNEGAPNIGLAVANGWPTEEQFRSADVIVAFCYLAWNDERKLQIKKYLERGGGLVIIHSATWTLPKADPAVAALMGVGGFTRFRHGEVSLEVVDSQHPICKGLPRRIPFVDEVYWPPTPALEAGRVVVLAVSREEEETTKRPAAQPMFWTCESGRGRVFGCVPGHYVWTFDDPWFRIFVLRGIAWAGGGPVYRFDPLVLRGARVARD